ncbi:MAG: Clp1/GlmU family protein [Candidatus Methanomethylicaceae archaeon]
MELIKGTSLVISGPSFLRLCRGSILALGKKVNLNEELIIKEGRSIPIEVIEDSLIEVKLGQNTFIEKFEGAIPHCWKDAVEKILSHDKPIKVVVIGDTDSGKSTFSIYLSNIAFERGFKVAVIDADPGQAEISLPTTIGYGFLDNGVISMDKIRLEEAFFIGSTTPSDNTLRMIIGVRKLLDKALLKKADLIVVNTCGWIYSYKAREFKCSLIQILLPDFLVAIQKENELEHIIKCCEYLTKVLIISPSPASKIRSREERKIRRENAYSKYFINIKEQVFNLNKVKILCNYYTYGKELPDSTINNLNKEFSLSITYGEIHQNLLFLVVKEEPKEINKIKEKINVDDVYIIREGLEKGIIVGLMNNDKLVGLGIISEIDYKNKKIKILTPYHGEISHICIGQIKLDENFHEVFKYPRTLI